MGNSGRRFFALRAVLWAACLAWGKASGLSVATRQLTLAAELPVRCRLRR
jgi:hypothetical protein